MNEATQADPGRFPADPAPPAVDRRRLPAPLIRVKVRDYSLRNPSIRDWLLSPGHIAAVEFREAATCSDGKPMYAACARVYLSGAGNREPLCVEDPASIQLLVGLAEAKQ